MQVPTQGEAEAYLARHAIDTMEQAVADEPQSPPEAVPSSLPTLQKSLPQPPKILQGTEGILSYSTGPEKSLIPRRSPSCVQSN